MINDNIFIVIDSKFKNIRFSVNFYTPISKENATYNQLLLKVLSSGCSRYPTISDINRRLATLYGSKMFTSVKRIENNFSFSFVFDVLCEKYSDKSTTNEIFSFAKEILTNPLAKNNAFDKDIVEREKNILRHEIEALINDKRRYANKKCIEIVCGDDEYGVNTHGYIDILDKVTPQELYSYYLFIISKCYVKIFAAGNVDVHEFKNEATALLDLFGDGKIEKTGFLPIPSSLRFEMEEAQITQGKLVMAFVVGEDAKKHEYTAMVFDGMFGGTVVSKLFNNVREKMSLCYYASSALIKQKGLILVQSGIDFENYEKARDAIFSQLEDIKNGVFTDEELKNAAVAVESSVLSVKDENTLLLNFYENQAGEEEILTPEETASRIKDAAVRSDITLFAQKIKPDTVFFLKGEK